MVLAAGINLIVSQQCIGPADNAASLFTSPAVAGLKEHFAGCLVKRTGQIATTRDKQLVFGSEHITLGCELVSIGTAFADRIVLPDHLAGLCIDSIKINVIMRENPCAEICNSFVDKDTRSDGPSRNHSAMTKKLFIVCTAVNFPDDVAVVGIKAIYKSVV